MYKGVVYSVCGLCELGCLTVPALGVFCSLMSPSDRGREAQHLSVKSPKTLANEEELMLRKGVWNSYDFHLFPFSVKDNL